MSTPGSQVEGHRSPLPSHVRTLVVGAGFAGLGMAATLRREDPAADVLVIERAPEVGGTWRDNTYPGCACDVPTALYSFSFAPSPAWSHTFARQPEILAYLKKVTADEDIPVHRHTELLGADWDADAQLWRVRTSRGELTASVLVTATGTLSEPKLPDVPGLGSFAGTTFHSARWDHDHDLTGERVGVIGTGASAIQFVPEIADTVDHLTVFQRTAAWVVPRIDRKLPRAERALYRRVPAVQRAVRTLVYTYREAYVVALAKAPVILPGITVVARALMRNQVRDGALRAKLTPSYTLGCKRLLLSASWLPTLARPDVDVVTAGIARITPTGVVDADGVEHLLDTIIFGTGFTPTEPPVAHLITAGGQSLAQHWAGSPHAHRGTTVAGFPNLFLMYGPNTNLGHSSIVFMLESQAAYVRDALRTMDSRGLTSVDVRPAAQSSYNAGIENSLSTTVWNAGGCSSWYFDATGRNSAMWPTFTWTFRRLTRRFDVENYTTARRSAEKAGAAA
jgi:cation diffusion facilitator CzcD-associated flavoprotein CzcO